MIAAAVIFGLAAAVVLSVTASSPADSMPGMALGSVAVLMAERTIVLFAVWMAVLVVVVRAFRAELPIEVSGRGVRYAEGKGGSMRTADGELVWLYEMVKKMTLGEEARRQGEGERG